VSGINAFWPQSGGNVRVQNVTNPGAGNEWVYTCPTTPAPGMMQRVLSLFFILTCDATVANRTVQYNVQDSGANKLAGVVYGLNQTASQAREYVLMPGFPRADTNLFNINLGWLPQIVLAPGYILRSNTVNLQAGDAYSSIRITLQEYRAVS